MKNPSKTKQTLIQKKVFKDEASEYAESIINTVREPLIVLDHNLRVVTASRSFYDFFKVKPEETEGQLIYDLGNRQWDIPKLRELLETILPQKITFDNYEVEHDFTTIGRRIMLLNARQIKRVLGKERIILLAIEDITERKRLEDILKESEELYKGVFNNASDGIVLLEKREGKIIHINPSGKNMLGYSTKECIGNKLQDIGFMSGVDDFQTIMKKLNENGIINYIDVSLATKSGQHINTDIYIADKTKVIQCNIRDVTERKKAENMLRESEERYRSIFKNSVMGISQAFPDGRLVNANNAYAQMYGYANAEEIMAEVSHVGQRYANPKDREEVLRILTEKGFMEPREIDVVRRDGTRFTVLAGAREIRDSDGNLQHYQAEHIDITERKRAEEALLESEEKLKMALMGAEMGMWDLDITTMSGKIDERAAQILGYHKVDLPPQSHFWDEMTHPDDVPRIKESIKAHLEGRVSVFNTEHRMRTATGEWKWVHGRGKITKRHIDGSPIQISGTIHDITDRKQSEKMLRESERKYRLLADNIHDVIFVMDMNLNYTYLSPSVKLLRGYEPEEAIKHTPAETVTPSSMDLALKILSEMMEIEKSEQRDVNISRTAEFEMSRKDGTTVWVETKAFFMRDENQRPIGIMGVTRDITERKRAIEELRANEELFRNYLEYAPDGVYMNDIKGNFIYGNRKCEDILGYRREELIGKNFLELNILPEKYLNKAVQLLQKNMEGKSTGPDELELISKEGHLIPVEINTSVVQRNGEGIVLAFVRDITERKQAEEELRKSEENFRLSLDDSPLGVRIVTMEGETLYANQATLKIYGYDRIEELKRTPIKERYTPESYAEFKTRKEKRERGEVSPSEYEINIVRKNGEVRHIQVFRKEIWWNGARQFQIIYQDITERKRSEEALRESEANYRQLFDNSPAGIYQIDYKSGRVLKANDVFCEYAGCSQEEINSLSLYDNLTEESKKLFLERMEKISLGVKVPEIVNDRCYRAIP